MILDTTKAKEIAAYLLQINAIKLQPQDPFTWASGWKSPIYCDNRLALSYPEVRKFICNEMVASIKEKYGTPDIIAGVATGAIGIGMLVAQAMDLPFVYVRPEAKKHGRKNQIEGISTTDKNVVVIEDLISTGKSSLNAVAALKEDGANVKGMIAIFSYGFKVADDNFNKEKLTLNTLSNYDTLLEHALDQEAITPTQLETLKTWKVAPDNWQPNN